MRLRLDRLTESTNADYAVTELIYRVGMTSRGRYPLSLSLSRAVQETPIE